VPVGQEPPEAAPAASLDDEELTPEAGAALGDGVAGEDMGLR